MGIHQNGFEKHSYCSNIFNVDAELFRQCLKVVTPLLVYCPAGSYVKPDAHGEKHCEGCPKNSYKPKDKYYDEKCKPCPKDKPRTAGVNSTAISDCRLGKCKRSSMFHVMAAMLVAFHQGVIRIGLI